ncbi:MAG: S9 family peptidase [Candidatus Wallbacteria bacterium HGW-Wallbacteria-1]|jgi:dipeptidyl aminopeptidase/acylaminoacyl peptidase|uniref:S9 family peptidase n=1 Tax=Candidatus Wallbacteria bacterium HGW-Wallbacteria-1 TaxID=2013854 RepID=A0A2N1PNU4_9BACT|nr:MAG: S9 family peptidase [Candidatus Wallbacteria bacterium HGW-Wallbacteria-1]
MDIPLPGLNPDTNVDCSVSESRTTGDSGETGDSGYLSPSDNLSVLARVWAADMLLPSPDRRWSLILRRRVSRSINEVTTPEIRVAGMRIDPYTRGPAREHGFSVIRLLDGDTLKEIEIQGLPEKYNICPTPRWSPDGRFVALTICGARTPEILWIIEPSTGKAWSTGAAVIRSLCHLAFSWMPDSSSLVATIAGFSVDPDNLLLEWAFAAPTAPAILECGGEASPVRTYQDLLRGPSDEDVFTRACSTVIAGVSLDGVIEPLSVPGLFFRAEPSPDGRYILAVSIERPFSYIVPWHRFPVKSIIIDKTGALVADLGCDSGSESIPQGFDAARIGARNYTWRDDSDADLTWVEALDGGDPSRDDAERDAFMVLSEPFTGQATCMAKLPGRFQGALWTGDGRCLITSIWRKTRRTAVLLARADGEPSTLFDYCYDDRYNTPGAIGSIRDSRGRRLAAESLTAGKAAGFKGPALLLLGEGACPEGDRPYIDAFDPETGARKRIWRCGPGVYHRPMRILDCEKLVFLIRCESREEYPNHWELTLSTGNRSASMTGYALNPLTDRQSEVTWLAETSRMLMKYRRADGVNLSGNLHLPPGKSISDGPFPTLIWAYPREFNDAALAGQVKDSPYRFPSVSPLSPLAFLGIGFAVLERPIMPIVGKDGEEPNDSYIHQLVLSAEAAVEELIRTGISKPGAIAVGGHSYGAFMAANLMIHTDVFCCGIARSGAYNRTLTPFGFQAEPRTFWQARETYLSISPFLNADRLVKPLLIIHGESDDNPGTNPLQSRMLFGAMKACGGTARMVILPGEGHGYTATESQLHMLREMEDWLKQHCG